MKVYAVIPDLGYDGYLIPDRIFSTKEKAEQYVKTANCKYYEKIEIAEYDLD